MKRIYVIVCHLRRTTRASFYESFTGEAYESEDDARCQAEAWTRASDGIVYSVAPHILRAEGQPVFGLSGLVKK